MNRDQVPQKPKPAEPVQYRTCCGENGVISTFFSMIFFPCNTLLREFIVLLMGENWFYDTIRYSYNYSGAPLVFELWDYLKWESKCRAKPCCDNCCNCDDCCYNCCCYLPFSIIYALYAIIMGILLHIVDMIFAVFQLAFGLVGLVISILLYAIYNTQGLSPIHVSLFYIWRAISRSTFILGIITTTFFNRERNLSESNRTIYTRKTWEDYKRIAKYSNIFSLNAFLCPNQENIAEDLLNIPILNVMMGFVLIAIGVLTLPITIVISICTKTRSISWLEWSGLHVFRGILGLTLVGIYFYNHYGRLMHNQSIRNRILGSVTYLPEMADKNLMSRDWDWRSVNDFIRFAVYMGKQLNPWSMNFLYQEDGEMNAMDVMATLPLLGFIPGILRLLVLFPFFFPCAFCHTLWVHRPNRPSYFRIFGLYLISGFFAVSIVLTWMNYIIYRKRNQVIPPEHKEPSPGLTTNQQIGVPVFNQSNLDQPYPGDQYLAQGYGEVYKPPSAPYVVTVNSMGTGNQTSVVTHSYSDNSNIASLRNDQVSIRLDSVDHMNHPAPPYSSTFN